MDPFLFSATGLSSGRSGFRETSSDLGTGGEDLRAIAIAGFTGGEMSWVTFADLSGSTSFVAFGLRSRERVDCGAGVCGDAMLFVSGGGSTGEADGSTGSAITGDASGTGSVRSRPGGKVESLPACLDR